MRRRQIIADHLHWLEYGDGNEPDRDFSAAPIFLWLKKRCRALAEGRSDVSGYYKNTKQGSGKRVG